MTKKPLITIIGSINMDMVTITDNIPVRGETVLGENFKTYPGGKGANQAVAAARLGGNVQIIGRVGKDSFGEQLINGLEQEGVSISCVETTTKISTGVATIIVSERDNQIIVVPGANYDLTPEYLEKYKEKILSSSLVVLQFEIPLTTISYCLDICMENQIPVILNPAPARILEDSDWRKATYITPNETEVEELFYPIQDLPQEVSSKLIVTMGDKGVKYTDNGKEMIVSAFKVNPIDTTGAGDTFNGALAVALAENMNLHRALEFANGAAALSIQRFGAQGGMPKRKVLEDFLKNNPYLN